MLWQALPKIGRRYGDEEAQRSYGNGGGRKQRRKKNDDDDVSAFITRLRSKEKPRHGLHRTSTTPKTATRAPGTETKVAGDVALAASTVQLNYRIAIRFKIQITLKFL